MTKYEKLKQTHLGGDLSSLQLFANALQKSGYANVAISDDPYSTADIIANKNGYTVCFECKQLRRASTCYDDLVIKERKLKDLKGMEDERTKCYLVFFYSDGVCYILSVDEPYTTFCRTVKKTTKFANQDYEVEVAAQFTRKNAKGLTFDYKIIY